VSGDQTIRSRLESSGFLKTTNRVLRCTKGSRKFFVAGSTYPVFHYDDDAFPESHLIFDANDMPVFIGLKDHLEPQPDGTFNIVRSGQVWASFTEKKKK
jgi:hypothetical protein